MFRCFAILGIFSTLGCALFGADENEATQKHINPLKATNKNLEQAVKSIVEKILLSNKKNLIEKSIVGKPKNRIEYMLQNAQSDYEKMHVHGMLYAQLAQSESEEKLIENLNQAKLWHANAVESYLNHYNPSIDSNYPVCNSIYALGELLLNFKKEQKNEADTLIKAAAILGNINALEDLDMLEYNEYGDVIGVKSRSNLISDAESLGEATLPQVTPPGLPTQASSKKKTTESSR
jgi:hypothetical protein